jgi:hypothetical protein
MRIDALQMLRSELSDVEETRGLAKARHRLQSAMSPDYRQQVCDAQQFTASYGNDVGRQRIATISHRIHRTIDSFNLRACERASSHASALSLRADNLIPSLI